jgi:hypothetical protein
VSGEERSVVEERDRRGRLGDDRGRARTGDDLAEEAVASLFRGQGRVL